MRALVPTIARLRPHLPSLAPGLGFVALMVVWAVQNGGYDPSTWYWGALLALGALTAAVLWPGRPAIVVARPLRLALAALALYVAWSYLSIAWAQSPGDALQGSNRALLYLALFAFAAVLPWTPQAALGVLLVFAAAIGVLAALFLARLADADGVAAIVVNGRLQAPLGYFNATAAMFTTGALTSVALAARRTLSPPLRGLLLGGAAAALQLAVTGESRGWLFTLPLVVLAAVAVVRDRIRFVLTAALPAAATIVVVHRLLGIYDARASPAVLDHAAVHAGGAALLACAITVGAGTLLSSADALLRPPRWLARHQRIVGGVIAALAVGAGVAGTVAATHGHPIGFLKRQWNGFSHAEEASRSASRFAVVGSGRYDFWRTALDAFRAHPVGGLGQDNFADYYVSRRHTAEEPAWTHSLEMRLLTHTGVVGALLFAAFVVAALIAALGRGAGREPPTRWAIGAALLPFLVWLIHGSIDWFWEMPALSGPAFGFLGMAGRLRSAPPREPATPSRRRVPRPLLAVTGTVALGAATVALAFPYLAVVFEGRAAREQSNPVQALHDLSTAASLNPLTAVPGRLAGNIALSTGQYEVALRRFGQAIEREPGGWFAWLGAGLAASELHEVARARHDLAVARSIDRQQPAIDAALARVGTDHPLTAMQALQMLIVVQ
jgi:hypothetical protein